MAGVHLAAAAEAISLGAKVGLDTKQLFEIISGAAGNSFMFKDRIPTLLSGEWKEKKTINDVIADLVRSRYLARSQILGFKLLTKRNRLNLSRKRII